jgi:hypothetical protein
MHDNLFNVNSITKNDLFKLDELSRKTDSSFLLEPKSRPKIK